MMRSFFTAMVVLAGFSGPAVSGYIVDSVIFYDDGDSYAVWEKHAGGTLYVTGSFRSRTGCVSYVSQRIGPPEGISPRPVAMNGGLQVTFTIDETVNTSGQGCTGSASGRKTMVVNGRITDDFVEIFYVSKSGRLLKHERTSIRG